MPDEATNGTNGSGTVGGAGAGTPPGRAGPGGGAGAVGDVGAGGVMRGVGGGSTVGTISGPGEGPTVGGGGGTGGVGGVCTTAGGSGDGVDVGAAEDAVTLTEASAGSDGRRLPAGGTAPLETIVLRPAMTFAVLPFSDCRAPVARQPSSPTRSGSAVLGKTWDGTPSVDGSGDEDGSDGSKDSVIAIC